MNYNYITSKDNISTLLSDLLKAKEIAMDTEATSLDTFSATWLLTQIEIGGNIYILDNRKLDKDTIHYIIELILLSNIRVIFHNAKYDLKIIYNNTKELLTNVYDTMVAEVLIHQGIGKQLYSYKEIVSRYFGMEIEKEVRETFFDYTGEITNEQLNYSAMDVVYLSRIKDLQISKLVDQKQGGILELECNLIAPVVAMELNGVLIDKEVWLKLAKKNQKLLDEHDRKIKQTILSRIDLSKYPTAYELASDFGILTKSKSTKIYTKELRDRVVNLDSWFYDNFNLNSPHQILKLLNLLGIPVTKTNEKELASLKSKDKIIDELLLHREYEKKVTTYGETLLTEENPKTKRYHFEYNQVGTYTGRFTVSRMQQIPRDSEFRKGFIARDEYLIVSSDFNQQEYRLAGALTKDERITEAYLSGKDMHTSTASLVYRLPMNEIITNQRNRAKSINFAILYDSSAWGLVYNLGLSVEEAEEIISILKEGYPRFIEYREAAKKMIWELGFSSTPLGRKRYFDTKVLYKDAKEYDRYKRRVMREGWNHMIQGWGADIIKISMDEIYYNNPFGDKLLFYNQAHDEIDTEVYGEISEECKDFVESCMVKAEQPQLGVIPAKVDSRILKYWSK